MEGTFRSALGNGPFRRVVAAYALGSVALGISAVVVAVSLFERSGSTTWATVGAAVRVLPFVLLSGVGGALADRSSYPRVLRLALGAQVVAAALVGLTAADAPLAAVAVAGLLAHVLWTVAYPTAAALIPTLVGARDLAAANALLSTLESAAWIVGPGLGGLVTAVVGPVAAAATAAVVAAVAVALAVLPVPDGSSVRRVQAREGLLPSLVTGVRAVTRSRTAVVSVSLLVVSNAVLGATQVLLLVAASDLLGMGEGGYGALNAAVATGAFAALAVVPRAARSSRPRAVLLVTVALGGLPLVLVPVLPEVPVALPLLAVSGLALVLAEVLVLTSLQRTAAAGTLARVFGILDSLLVGAILAGTLLAGPLLRVVSVSWALAIVGGLLPLAALVIVPRLPEQRDADAADLVALAPIIELLRQLPMLRAASPTAVEAMAAAARTEDVDPGTAVVRQGEPADDFYVVLAGEVVVDVTHSTGIVERVRVLGPGSGFGELGILASSPRTATVTTVAPCRLVRVPGDVFLGAVGPGVSVGGFGPGAAVLDYVMAR